MARTIDIDALYRRHGDELLRWFARRTADAQTALDLWAESFAQAVAAQHRCRATDPPAEAAWLWAIAHRQLARYLRRGYAERRAMRKIGLERPPADPSLLDAIEREAGLDVLRRELSTAMASLTPAIHRAVRLRVVDGLPYPEVARRLAITEPAARARVSRGLNSLADVLDPLTRSEAQPS